MKLFLIFSISICFTIVNAEESSVVDVKKADVILAEVKESIYLDDLINRGLVKVIEKMKETKGKVAIMDFPGLDGVSTGLSSYVANKAGNKLIEVGRQVVDRSTLEKVIIEQKLQQNSLMDATTAAKVGKLAGAGVFIIGSYTKTESKFVLTIRALSVELGQFIPGAVAEEILRNPSIEFTKEVNELINTKNLESKINLNSSEVKNENEVKTTSNEEIAFDNRICKEININTQASKIIQIALETQFLSGKDLVKDWWYQDVIDDYNIKKTAISIGNWSFEYNHSIWQKESVANWVDGGSTDSYKIDAWLYTGDTASIKDINKCVPKLRRWNTSRGNGVSSKKKK